MAWRRESSGFSPSIQVDQFMDTLDMALESAANTLMDSFLGRRLKDVSAFV
jgi:hypothetical protein